VYKAAAAKRPVGSVISAAPQDRQNFLPGVIGATAGADGLNPGATILAEARALVILPVALGALHAEPPVNRVRPVSRTTLVRWTGGVNERLRADSNHRLLLKTQWTPQHRDFAWLGGSLESPVQWVMSPFQIDARADAPQTTPHKLTLLTSSPLGLFGFRWEQLPG
jgi:hypothetical protein